MDVRDLGCDFYAFSGHKLYGPTGIGVLYGKGSLLEEMPPYQAGGEMIRSVTFEETLYNTLPNKFEAGTPNIAGAIGLGAAIDYIGTIGMDEILVYESELLQYGTDRLSGIEGLTIIGTADKKGSVISFIMEGVHPHDIGTILDAEGIAIRTGHHCAQPLMKKLNITSCARASFGIYNNQNDVDCFVEAIKETKNFFK